jgi:hypothetical protein
MENQDLKGESMRKLEEIVYSLHDRLYDTS